MADPIDRYPISTADGKFIQLDTVRPAGLYIIDISNTPSSLLTFTGSYKTVALYSTVDCVVRFGATAAYQNTWLSQGFLVPKETIITLSPTTMSISAATVGTGSTGILSVSILETWAGLGLKPQYEGR